MRRKSWQERKRMSRQEEEETEQKEDDKEEERGSAIGVVPDKTAIAVKKGLVITNIKF